MGNIFIKDSDRQNFSMSLELMYVDEYMCKAPGDYVKVYIYGLRLCQFPLSNDMSCEKMASYLDLDEQAVLGAFTYWQRIGLLKLVSVEPLQVEYASLHNIEHKSGMAARMMQYAGLNAGLQNIFGLSRLIKPNEFAKAIDWVETFGFSQDAIFLLVEFCIEKAGSGRRISFNYIDKVAKQWADMELIDAESAGEYINRYSQEYSGAKSILKRWNVNRPPTTDEVELYSKWVRSMEMHKGAVIEASKGCHTFKVLDIRVGELHNMGISTAGAAKSYYSDDEETSQGVALVMKELRRSGPINNKMKELYKKWLGMGYTDKVLRLAAGSLSREGNTRPDDLDMLLTRWAEEGIIEEKNVRKYLKDADEARHAMGELVAAWGEDRAPTGAERRAWLRWVREGSKPTIIAVAAEYAGNIEGNRIAYMSKLLINWEEAGLNTPDAIRENSKKRRKSNQNKQNNNNTFKGERSYSQDELDEMIFDDDL